MIKSGLFCITLAISSVFTTDYVNIRKGPSTDTAIYTTVDPGTEISKVKDYDSEWSEIQMDGNKLYICSRYISDKKQSADASGQLNGGTAIGLNKNWKYADYSMINSGNAILYKATAGRKNIVVGVNAGHGTKGGESVKTYCHPDMTAKVTGGSTAAGSVKATAVSGGMNFNDGTREPVVTLKMARILRDRLLAAGYDVLMIRDADDVQLDNIARTVICNNMADCHIAIHWDGDGLSYDKGCFYMSVPDGIKGMEPVKGIWKEDNRLGDCLIAGLKNAGNKIFDSGRMAMDLTQTSYSSIPSVDIELGNQSSDHSDAKLNTLADGLMQGINSFFTK